MKFGEEMTVSTVAVAMGFALTSPAASAFQHHPTAIRRFAAPRPTVDGREGGPFPHRREAFAPSSFSAATGLRAAFAEDLAPGVQAIDAANDEFNSLLEVLRDQSHFRLYSCDMLASCEYMPQELFECYSETCEIYPVDDEDVPPSIKSVDMDEHEFELDGWSRWDMPSDDYYDMDEFPEDFTGYDGSEVWTFIHNRIGFHDDTVADEYDSDNWKADFNKAVSGLHSMVSAQVIRGIGQKIADGEDFDEDVVWTDPQVEFQRRLSPNGETPKAIENLYFSYMLMLTAVASARNRLLNDCDSGKIDADAAAALRPVLAHPILDDPSIYVAAKKLHDHAVKDEGSVEALWEARMRSRDLMRIMNCVQCNKCRFHGKVSVLGLTTALQVILGRTGNGGDASRIHRVELAALMTALGKFSSAVNLVEAMQS